MIADPLLADGSYYAEMTIKKLLKDQKNYWSLEIPGYAEEHLCNPYYNDSNCNFSHFDELQGKPVEHMGTCVLIYGDDDDDDDDVKDDVLRWYEWIKNVPSVNFVFCKRENNVVKKRWFFYDVRPCNMEYRHLQESIWEFDEAVVLEFYFGKLKIEQSE